MSIEQNAQISPPLFINVRKPASSLSTLADPQDIADTEAADCLNVIFDRGYATPRPGSVLAWSKPTGETQSALNTFTANTSNQKQYVMSIYGNHVYVYDPVNNQSVLLNGSYTPASTTLLYGFTNWNAGIGNDYVFFGNGTDSSIKWWVSMDYTTKNQLATDTVITLSSVAQFPATGTVAIMTPNTTVINATYTSITGTTLNLSAPLGATVGSGATVCSTIIQCVFLQLTNPTNVPIGKVFATFMGRLIVCNSKGSETLIRYSQPEIPDNFYDALDGTPSNGGFIGIPGGTGEITGATAFGLYLAVLKGDSFQRVDFSVDSTNSVLTTQVTPLISGSDMGCPSTQAWTKKNNTIYYPSLNAGILSVAPLVTGYQTTIQLSVLSQKIQNTYLTLNFTNGPSVGFQTKILWAAASNTSVDTILVYDTLYQYWTKFNGWAVKDWINYNNNLYYISSQDGNVYQVLVSNTYTDNGNAYTSYSYSKRYDFGNGSMPKTESLVFMQGYIQASTKLYVDVMFNEQGTQQTITYLIDGSQPYAIQPISKALAMVMMGLPIMGGSDLQTLNGLGIFKVYLPLPLKYGFFNVQFKVYATGAGANWSWTGLGMDPRVEFKAPANMVINTTGVVATTASTAGTIIIPSTPQVGLISATQVLTGIQSGSNVTLNLSSTTFPLVALLWISRNGQILTPTTDYTQSGNTVTVLNASASDIYLVAYTH